MNYCYNFVIISPFAVVIRTTIGLLALAWAPISLLKHEYTGKIKLAVLFIANVFWIGFRVASLAMLASMSVFLLFFFSVVHFCVMLGYINMELKPTNPEGYEWAGMALLAALYIIYYVNFFSETSMLFSLFYVIIVSYENASCMALFLFGPMSGIVTSILVCGIAVGMLSCYKFSSLYKVCPEIPYL